MKCKINIQQRKRKQGVRKLWFIVLLSVYVLFVCAIVVLKSGTLQTISKNFVLEGSFDYHHVGRHRRDTRSNNDSFVAEDEDEQRNCTPRAIDQFPANWFTLQETRNGAIALHIFLSLYMFGALAIVCDDYFVSSLECICERLHLQEDVAGATFMAAGSSAPEFFTSIIGVFIAKSDVGVGTIVGSAVFNILFIIGVCAIFAGMVVKLTWYPMTRDCLFYLISIAALVIIIDDERVYWYEGLILVFLYILYIVIMFFNRTLEVQAKTLLQRLKHKLGISDHLLNSKAVAEEKQPLSEHSQKVSSYTNTMHVAEDSISKETQFTGTASTSASLENTNEHHEKEYESPFAVPDTILAKLYWAVMMPLKVLMYLTIPDCRKDGIFKRLYMLTFTMSIIWIAGSAYIMVWMVTIVGDTLEIPDTVMGLTILAAGTSVPDCLSSVFVARDGYGDMAVSNSIGSNVFDILICLGLPWLLGTTIVKKGEPIFIHSGGMIYSSLILLSTVAFMLVGINLAKWTLRKPFGCLCLLAYCLVITISCLFELNVFGDFVLPSCDRT